MIVHLYKCWYLKYWWKLANTCMSCTRVRVVQTLDDQTQVDSKPAGQPEQASLNQCQLIAAIYNSPKLVLCASQAKVSL